MGGIWLGSLIFLPPIYGLIAQRYILKGGRQFVAKNINIVTKKEL